MNLLMDDAGRLGFSVNAGETFRITLNKAVLGHGKYNFRLKDTRPCGKVDETLEEGHSTFTCKAKFGGMIQVGVRIKSKPTNPVIAADGGESSGGSGKLHPPTILDNTPSVTPCNGCVFGESMGDLHVKDKDDPATIKINCSGASITVQHMVVEADDTPTIHWETSDTKAYTVIFPDGKNPCIDQDGKPQAKFTGGSCFMFHNPKGEFSYAVAACGNDKPVDSKLDVK